MILEPDMLKVNMKFIFKTINQLIEELGFTKDYDGDWRTTSLLGRDCPLINSDMVWHINGKHICQITEARSFGGIYDFRYKPDEYGGWCANCDWVYSYSKDGVWYVNEDMEIDFEIEGLFAL